MTHDNIHLKNFCNLDCKGRRPNRSCTINSLLVLLLLLYVRPWKYVDTPYQLTWAFYDFVPSPKISFFMVFLKVKADKNDTFTHIMRLCELVAMHTKSCLYQQIKIYLCVVACWHPTLPIHYPFAMDHTGTPVALRSYPSYTQQILYLFYNKILSLLQQTDTSGSARLILPDFPFDKLICRSGKL